MRVILLLIFLIGFARSQEALDIKDVIGMDEIEQTLLGLEIPNQSKSGKFSYSVKNIKITSVNIGSIKLYNPEGLKFYVEIDDLDLSATADADASYKFRFLWKTRKISASFSAKASLKDTNLKQGFDAKVTSTGVLAVPTTCKCNIGDFKVKLKGKKIFGKFISGIVNVLTKVFKNKLTKRIESQICKKLPPLLEKNLKNIDLTSVLSVG